MIKLVPEAAQAAVATGVATLGTIVEYLQCKVEKLFRSVR